MLDAQLLTLDGGNYSDTKELQLSTREERSWKSKVTLILNKEILESTLKRMASINNGTLSMLMNGRENQVKENSMKTSDSTLKEISM
jgi:hypothetical protein